MTQDLIALAYLWMFLFLFAGLVGAKELCVRMAVVSLCGVGLMGIWLSVDVAIRLYKELPQ